MYTEEQRRKIQWLLIGAFAFSAISVGAAIPLGVVTISSLSLMVGAGLVGFWRLQADKPILPKAFLEIPVVITICIYFAIGLSTGLVAADKKMFVREVIQRLLIIALPLYLFSMGPRDPKQIKTALLAFLPLCGVVALYSIYEARHIGFEDPVYAMGMHKNHIAGICANMGVVAVACLLTSRNRRRRLILSGFLLLAVFGCIAVQGKAGLLTIPFATVFMLIAIRAKPKNILYFAVAVCLGAATCVIIMPKKAMEHVVSTKKFSSNDDRIRTWSEVLPMLEKDPMKAVGWGQWRAEHGIVFSDCANATLFDWMQMGILGGLTHLAMIFFSVKLAMDNARRMPLNTLLSFINLVALGLICARFAHGQVDTFWVGRGVNLTTFMAVGIAVFVRLLLDQVEMSSCLKSRHSTQLTPTNGKRSAITAR